MPESKLFCNLVLHVKASRTLFVGSLEPDIQEHEILAFFSPFGHIEHVDIKRPPPGNPSAYAFVRFENIDMTARAKMLMNGQCVRSTHCKIGFGKPAPSKSVYIGGLSSAISSENLFDLLTKFGSLNYFFYEVGQNFAIASYINEEMAATAVSNLRGHKPENFDSEIYLDFSSMDIPSFLMQNTSLVKEIIAANTDSLAIFSIRELTFFPAPVPTQRKRLFDLSFLRSLVPCKFEQDNSELCQVSTILDLKNATEPSIGMSTVTLKSSIFPFDSYHLAGNRDLSEELIKEKCLSISKRLSTNAISVSETVETIARSLNEKPTNISIVLGLAKHTSLVILPKNATTTLRPLPCLIAYLRLKNSAALIRSSSYFVVLLAPGSFSLCLLKLAAPKLPCDVVTLNEFIVLLVCKNKSKYK
ncbi:RNA-binding protein 15 [Cichlidogyrus casuarinus]|uniref:RNA-binding protein 15 n=1 Tax=Cichlidogyrus casuarinus TaxID=1844966 RepID=A0ABD2Q3H1_9PLAT